MDNRAALIEYDHPELSIRQQCVLLCVNRSSLYYMRAPIDEETLTHLRWIDEIYTQYPFFGTRKMAGLFETASGLLPGQGEGKALIWVAGYTRGMPRAAYEQTSPRA